MTAGHKKTCLTRRETEILSLAAQGYTYKESGKQLGISPRTCQTHGAHAINFLEAKSITHAVAIALKENIIK